MRKSELVREILLNNKEAFTREDIAKAAETGTRFVQRMLNELAEEGYVFADMGDYLVRSKATVNNGKADYSKILPFRDFRFGLVSDTHIGSKHERLDSLNAAYQVFKKEGIELVFHVGDLTEGVGVFRGQEFELKKYGQQQQIDYFVEEYPEVVGIITAGITGNHDLRQYERGGVDPGVSIGNRRKDFDYLGQMIADVRLRGGVEMELMHPGGGQAYALSYKAQKDINNRPQAALPEILAYGHYHTSYYMHYRGVEFVQVPSFKDSGLWEKRLGMNSVLGGWIVDVKLSDDEQRINQFTPNLFTFD